MPRPKSVESAAVFEMGNRRTIRLKNYDYSETGYYFVTICSYKKECLFGRVEGERVLLSAAGKIVEECWNQIPRHFPRADLDLFVVMPNHLHGILVIRDPRMGEACLAPTMDQKAKATLADIVGSFKSAVSKATKTLLGKTQSGSVWQRNYYDHVIRGEKDLYKTREYVANNPLKWELDEENPEFVTVKD